MRIFRFCLVLVFIVTLFGTNAFALGSNEIRSYHIREADGTSGQDTNSGSGIKTDHIQDGAVTTEKMADGSVTDTKILGPISASKISSAGLAADTVDGMHASDLAPFVHSHGIPDVLGLDAILGTKADVNHNHDNVYSPLTHNHDGVYSPAVHEHAQSEITGLDAALAAKADVLHNHDDVYQKRYGKVAVVAQSGGDYVNPIAAMNDINSWCGIPSASNPCLVKIMPGIYNIDSASLVMSSYVDIEGSGENTTKIVGAGDANESMPAVVYGGSYAELRFLTIENTGGNDYGLAMTNQGVDSVKLNHVTLKAAGETKNGNYGLVNNYATVSAVDVTIAVSGNHSNVGVSSQSSTFTANDVNITVSGNTAAIGINGGSMTLNNVKIRTSGGGSYGYALWTGNGVTTVSNSDLVHSGGYYGVVNVNTSLVITNSTVTGDLFGIYSTGDGPSVRVSHSTIKGGTSIRMESGQGYVGASELDGPVAGSLACAGVYDANFAPVVCQ